MCLDISYYSALSLIDDYFPNLVHNGEIEWDLDRGMHFMAMGHSRYPVVLWQNNTYQREYFEWGVVADYMNTPEKIKAMRKSMVNVRSEKVLGDPRSYWNRIRGTRCLMPVTGFIEHRAIEGWKNKVPYYIRLKDRDMFCIPALYHYNKIAPSNPETAEITGTFAPLTREANSFMRQIHNSGDNPFRMPLLLSKDLELEWLRRDLTESDIERILSYEMPSSELIAHPIFSVRGRKPRPDRLPKIAPFDYLGLPRLEDT